MNQGAEMNLSMTRKVLKDVALERMSQYKKWGNQQHEWLEWLPILGEEFGEVCEAISGRIYSGTNYSKETDASNLYRELIQLAAVSVQMAELIKAEES